MADNISNLFNNLKTSILGTKSAQIDKEIDSSIQSIELYSSKLSQNKYIEALKDLVKSSGNSNTLEDVIPQLQGSYNNIESYNQAGRIQRYTEYDIITEKISYCERALNVLTDNIISPDDITKRTILILRESDKSDIKEHQNKIISRLQNINKSIKLENHIRDLVKKTLKKGDMFIEILHSPKGENALTIINENVNPQRINTFIRESIELTNDKDENYDVNVVVEDISFGGVLSGSTPLQIGLLNKNGSLGQTHASVDIEPISKDNHPTDSVDDRFKNKFETDNNKSYNSHVSNKDLKDIFISLHDPKYIIKLESERFKTCLGYLVFPKADPSMQSFESMNTSMSATDALCSKILDQIAKKINLNSTDSVKLTDDLKKTIVKYIHSLKSNDDLKIRYVSPQQMIHWKINVDKYSPYGESIFDVVKFDAALLMALKVSTTIKRITSSVDKRIINIETGLPRDAKNLVEMVREGMRKRKISVDNFGSIDSIPSLIPSFEDIYIPMRDGKKFVEFDHTQWGPNAQDDIEPLKFIRDNIVADLGVPAPFLGLEENTCFPSYTKIPLLEGFSVELIKLIEEYERDPESFNKWTYSIDPETNKVVPGRILKAIRTRQNAELVRVHLDNGKFEDCTPDHLWMLRDGLYKQAIDLVGGDSLMPLYIKESTTKTKNNVPYMQIYHPGTAKWQVIHRCVSESLNMLSHGDRKQIHHINENPLDNHPSNLVALTSKEHLNRHGEKCRYNSLNKNTYSTYEKRNCVVCSTEFECLIQKNQSTCLSESCKIERKRLDGLKSWGRKKKLCGDDYLEVSAKCVVCGKEFITYKKYLEERTEKWITCGNYECGRVIRGKRNTERVYGENETLKIVCEICGKDFEINCRQEHKTNTCSIKCMNTVLSRRRQSGNRKNIPCSFCGDEISVTGYQLKTNRYIPCSKESCKSMKQGVEVWLRNNPQNTIDDYINLKPSILNHKVVRVEILTEKQDCGDLEIEHYHNFAVSSGVFVHNSNRALLTVENILFARTIIAYQKELSKPLKELFEKIYSLVYDDELDLIDTIKITFSEPKVSPYEHEMEYVEQMQRLIESYKALGIPELYLKKKYLPGVDWDEIDNFKAEETLKKELATEESGDDSAMGGMGGGFSGGMSGGY